MQPEVRSELSAQLFPELLSQLPATLFALMSPELQSGVPAELRAPVQSIVYSLRPVTAVLALLPVAVKDQQCRCTRAERSGIERR
jgi:hypothetical protein